jgi:hypothetical protein
MANIEMKLMLAGCCKLQSFSIFCLSPFQIFESELICFTPRYLYNIHVLYTTLLYNLLIGPNEDQIKLKCDYLKL